MQYDVILQKALEIIIEVLLPVLLAMLVAWLKKQYDLVKAKIPAEQWAFASELAYALVLAAEQNGLKEELLKTGQEKKEWVIGKLDENLRQHGIELNLDQLSDLIESAVFEALTQGKP